jgi:N-acetylmuramic acid 6-phosphate (MurNAc-6-P) etherase
MELLQLTLAEADDLLKRAEGSVKLAIAMHRLGCDAQEAGVRLDAAGGFLSRLSAS